jgi:hypothetical protein
MQTSAGEPVMTFQTVLLIIVIPFSMWLAIRVVQSLASGLYRHGDSLYHRREEPADYWFQIVWSVVLIAGFLYVAIAENGLRFPITILAVPPVVFWLIRSLARNEVSFANELLFVRDEQPKQYWLAIFVGLLALGSFIWPAVLRLS